ncbi:MAG: HAMP domain-containing sensor histidine kinase, partial [Stagnimonas sp.]|nr:HAMP domain-containing sensor histidine kinase [Stagnimonas sp.]
GELIGHLLLERDLSDLRRQTEVTIATSFASFVLALLLIAVLLALAQPRIVAPILDLAAKAAAIRLTRDYNLRARRQGQDEVGSLVDSFNAMLDEIQQTQSQLVQSEKMAALAGLVAGVAHEVNTPIGIGVTGISHLRQELQRVEAAWQEGSLGRQQLERFLQLCAESTLLVMTHLERAADLVASFKKVAVDQTADDMREFELGGYLREVVLSLAPMFKNSRHELRLEPSEPIPLLSYPGAVAQIVTNLVMNAQIHGLDGIAAGQVTVSASRQGDEVRLSVADNGRGIPLAHRDSLFQPFFTTRRHAGGTGLGLHLVYNLVTQRLRGRIVFESTEGQGTVFHVSFPCRATTP